jgi:hypothetical protein
MGSMFSGGSTPSYTPPAAPPPAAAPATLANASVALAGGNTRQRAAAAAGLNDTNQTGPQGLTSKPSTAQATLLGQ